MENIIDYQAFVDADETADWAMSEFGASELGDIRRNGRLVLIAKNQLTQIGSAMSLCCGNNSSRLVSRFFKRKEVTMDSITKYHKNKTASLSKEYDCIFAVQDTTTLDFTSHKSLQGLGHIATNDNCKGLLMHTVLAVTPDRTPLGIIDAAIRARDPDTRGKKKNRKKLDIKDKESCKWLEGLRKTEAVLDKEQKVLLIGDRESDIYALFIEPRRPATDILVRAVQNRIIKDEQCRKLLEYIDRSPELGSYVLDVPRQGKRPAHKASMQVKGGKVTLSAPANSKEEVKSVTLSFIWTNELNPPDGVNGINQLLLTSFEVSNLDRAKYCIDAYSARWVIEEYHRVLKSGCRVEVLQFETLDSLLPAIGLRCIIALRVLFLSKYAREFPDKDCSSVCSKTEQKVLENWLSKQAKKKVNVKTIKDFVYGVAMMGGCLNRKSDGPPGTKTLWRGITKLQNMVEGYKLALETLMKAGVTEMS